MKRTVRSIVFVLTMLACSGGACAEVTLGLRVLPPRVEPNKAFPQVNAFSCKPKSIALRCLDDGENKIRVSEAHDDPWFEVCGMEYVPVAGDGPAIRPVVMPSVYRLEVRNLPGNIRECST